MSKAIEIYKFSKDCVSSLPNDENTKVLILSAVKELKSIDNSLSAIREQMNNIASTPP